jgi:hypothetical protein
VVLEDFCGDTVMVGFNVFEIGRHPGAKMKAVFKHMRSCDEGSMRQYAVFFSHFEIISLRLMRSSPSFSGGGLLRVRDSATLSVHVSAILKAKWGYALPLDSQAGDAVRLS